MHFQNTGWSGAKGLHGGGFMSRMLSLFDGSWSSAKAAAKDGRPAFAIGLLTNLLGRPDLPTDMARKAHRLNGKLHHAAGRYAEARRQFREAIDLDPSDAEAHYRLGLSHETDPYGSDRRAAICFRKATKLDPSRARYWAALSRAAIRAHAERLGLSAAKQAVALEPTNAANLGIIVEGLRELGRNRKAWKIVSKARFLAPHDPAIRTLWDRVCFDLARIGHHASRRHTCETSAAVLPFIRIVGHDGESKIIRRDDATNTVPHFGRAKR